MDRIDAVKGLHLLPDPAGARCLELLVRFLIGRRAGPVFREYEKTLLVPFVEMVLLADPLVVDLEIVEGDVRHVHRSRQFPVVNPESGPGQVLRIRMHRKSPAEIAFGCGEVEQVPKLRDDLVVFIHPGPAVSEGGQDPGMLVVLAEDVVDEPHRLDVGIHEEQLLLLVSHVGPSHRRIDLIVHDPVGDPSGIVQSVVPGSEHLHHRSIGEHSLRGSHVRHGIIASCAFRVREEPRGRIGGDRSCRYQHDADRNGSFAGVLVKDVVPGGDGVVIEIIPLSREELLVSTIGRSLGQVFVEVHVHGGAGCPKILDVVLRIVQYADACGSLLCREGEGLGRRHRHYLVGIE